MEPYELDGPLLLLAGPGTGKTFNLVKRVKHLVEDKKAAPDSVAVITFTTAATAEMRARISSGDSSLYIKPELRPRTIRTMHSLGQEIIAGQWSRYGLPENVAVVHSTADSRMLLGDAAQLAGTERDVGQDVHECRTRGDCNRGKQTKCSVCALYRQILRACGCVDHDDQILLACEILEGDQEVCAEYRERTRHLLIDEYQDINAAQRRLIGLLAEGQLDGLFVVGDDDQSIYSWRGGSPRFIRAFVDDFGESATIKPLLHSRRCHAAILQAAVAVVRAFDPGSQPKGDYTYQKAEGPKPQVHSVPSEKAEADVVMGIVRRARGAQPPASTLLLVPTREHATAIVQQLKVGRVPFSAFSQSAGTGLPLVARLASWIDNKDDNLALRACLDALLNSTASTVPSDRSRRTDKRNQREQALRQVSQLWTLVLEEDCSLWDALQRKQHEASILEYLHDSCAEFESCGVKEVGRFLELVGRALEPWKTRQALIREVDGWLRAAESQYWDAASGPPVRVMTLQGAKGLEADVVCLIGLEEGALPRNTEPDDLAEQSRLAFVSMTRAKEELHLFCARQRSGRMSRRSIHGKTGPHQLAPSRFLDALGTDHVDRVYHRPRKVSR